MDTRCWDCSTQVQVLRCPSGKEGHGLGRCANIMCGTVYLLSFWGPEEFTIHSRA